jgi:hypothetical protein
LIHSNILKTNRLFWPICFQDIIDTQPFDCPAFSIMPGQAGHFCRWAKAAGEEASWRMPVILSGALPLTYPAALGLRPSDRPPPFALWRSGMLLPAAGAAVAAGPASTGSVAHQLHPPAASTHSLPRPAAFLLYVLTKTPELAAFLAVFIPAPHEKIMTYIVLAFFAADLSK